MLLFISQFHLKWNLTQILHLPVTPQPIRSDVCLLLCVCLLFVCLFITTQDVVIQEKDNIRLRIVGTRVDANDIVS